MGAEPSLAEIREKKLWLSMGLREEEYQRIIQLLGREPNYTELGMFAVLWSEHCAYKHTRPLFKAFPTMAPHVLQGPGENAGVVDLGDGQALVMKVESHNHPSAIEPYQGAATGVGGILRDIFTMGARPIAVLDSLRFGDLDDPRTRYLFTGVVAGIAGYGNATGVPTVGGEAYFDRGYNGNPLVNVMCVGLARTDKLVRAKASQIGGAVMVVGARTGRDGIHGATFASAQLDEDSASRRPSVQVGDPFTEKLLMEACLEAMDRDLIAAIQDMGAAGLTSSAAEMASRGGTGIEMDIALVPRREEGMTSYEVMLSESQERMLVIPVPGKEEEVTAIFRRWGLEAAIVGRVTADGLLRIKEGGRVVAEVPVRALTEEAPVYRPQAVEPAYLKEARAFTPETLPEPKDLTEAWCRLLASPNLASKAWIYEQYDHMVQTNTVLAPGGDAAVLRLKGTKKGVALTIEGNGRYTYLDPREGAKLAVAEAARNLACVGAEPLAVTDGLNYGNPEKPEIFWQIVQGVEGIAEACRALEIPVISGNASLYNEANGEAIYPTPIIGMAGLLPDVSCYVSHAFRGHGDAVLLLGETRGELGGSEYLYVMHHLVAGIPPRVDLAGEKRLHSLCRRLAKEKLVRSMHDCAEGGLAVAVAESALGRGIGAVLVWSVDLSGRRPEALLFGEDQGRILVSVTEKHLPQVLALAQEYGIPVTLLGRTGGERVQLTLRDERTGEERMINLPLEEIRRIWEGALPQRLSGLPREEWSHVAQA